jgi:hypothetical protein
VRFTQSSALCLFLQSASALSLRCKKKTVNSNTLPSLPSGSAGPCLKGVRSSVRLHIGRWAWVSLKEQMQCTHIVQIVALSFHCFSYLENQEAYGKNFYQARKRKSVCRFSPRRLPGSFSCFDKHLSIHDRVSLQIMEKRVSAVIARFDRNWNLSTNFKICAVIYNGQTDMVMLIRALLQPFVLNAPRNL